MYVSMRYGVSVFSGYLYAVRNTSTSCVKSVMHEYLALIARYNTQRGFPDGELHQRTLLDVYFFFCRLKVIS